MKPNDFKMNTDYASIANVSNKTYRVTFASHSVPTLNHTIDTYDLAVDPAPGALSQYIVSIDGNNYYLGNSFDFLFNNKALEVELRFCRVSAKTLRVTLVSHNITETAQNLPTLDITIKESLFIPPDLF